MYQIQKIKNIITKIREIMQTIISDAEDYNLSVSQHREVLNAITEIRCECSNLELEIDEMFTN